MKFSMSRPEVHLNRLEPIQGIEIEKERSMLTYSGVDRLGLNCRIASYLRDCGANIRSCSERLHDIDPIFGSHYVIEATHENMSTIQEEKILQICDECDEPIESTLIRHPLIFVVPDKPGTLAKIGEILLGRKISILANDTVTFMAPFPMELGGDGSEARMATISMLIGISMEKYDSQLEGLRDGLEYLEHRFSWYIRLEQARQNRDSTTQSNRWNGIFPEFLPTTQN